MARSVLITGASSGIGAAAAERLAKRGFDVYGTSRNPDALESDAPRIHWIAMDVRDEKSVNAGLRAAEEQAGGLDALVCNAGFGVFGSVEELSLEAGQRQFDTNFFGTLRAVRAALPAMRARRRGRIVLVSSLAARAPIPFQAHYSATKAAVNALGLSLHAEVRPYGIRIVLVEPGDIDTGFNDAMSFGDSSTSAYGDAIRETERVIRESLPKAPGPETVARAIERALTARHPRVRYAVGPDSWAVPLGSRLLPDSVFLRFIRAHFGV